MLEHRVYFRLLVLALLAHRYTVGDGALLFLRRMRYN
jgi:hypothetical protein